MADDEEESMSEGFSASEDEWKPSKNIAGGGESSDDDDSDFEQVPVAVTEKSRKKEPKARSATKAVQGVVKKRKPGTQSLRTKLFNKYRPPPKTLTSPSSGTNSPSASTSRMASKNAQTPNEASEPHNDSSSESSVDDYLVNASEIDLQSSFFNVPAMATSESPLPIFDCNAGVKNLSDSDSEDNNESSTDERKAAPAANAFDFRNLLEKANSLERAKETIAKRAAEQVHATASDNMNATMDVSSLLALGENSHHHHLQQRLHSKNTDDGAANAATQPNRLQKTKSTRIKKRQNRTRPNSTLVAHGAGDDSDDSDLEEVADDTTATSTALDSTAHTDDGANLEILVEFPSRQRARDRKQQDLEMAFRRKLNRDLKERQLLLHKTSLLCCFARSYKYNRLINSTALWQKALQLLPSKNSYPPEQGTELRYFQAFVTWFKTAIKLTNENLYASETAASSAKTKWRSSHMIGELLEQMNRKEARCKQDMVFIFVALLRGMGLQCRLVVNMQPLSLKPAQSDLLTIKLKPEADKKPNNTVGVGVKKEDIVVKEKATVPTKRSNSVDSSKENKSSKAKVLKVSKSEEGEEKNTAQQKRSQFASSKSSHQSAEEIPATESTRRLRNPTTVDKAANENKTTASNAKDKVAEEKSKSINKKPTLSKLKRSKSDENKPSEAATISSKVKPKEPEKKKSKTEEANSKESVEVKPSEANSTVKGKSKANSNESVEAKPSEAATSSVKGKSKEPEKKKSKTEEANSKDNPENIAHSKKTSTKPDLRKLKFVHVDSKASFEVMSPQLVHEDMPSTSKAKKTAPKETTKVAPKVVPKITIKRSVSQDSAASSVSDRITRSRSKSPKFHIAPGFLMGHDKNMDEPKKPLENKPTNRTRRPASKSPNRIAISTAFLKKAQPTAEEPKTRVLRSRQKTNDTKAVNNANGHPSATLKIPQLDGADDAIDPNKATKKSKRPQLKKLQKSRSKDDNSDDDFEPSPPKKPKKVPVIKDRRVLSTDDESVSAGGDKSKRKPTAADIWVEVWCDVEQEWMCVDLFKGSVNSVESIRKSASSGFVYCYAFQNDLSIKDVTARYCPQWTTVHKQRVDRAWLETAISEYYGPQTERDRLENQQLRRLHEEKPLPTTISEFKDHPLYALERHLLKFQAIYPPDAATCGFVRGEPIYPRFCVHTLHSREIWLKQARTVKMGEQPYKIVKARPKWDRINQTVIKDQPLDIFGYWQTEDYVPPTAENGIVPRNAYGNVELFKECMLPKKTVHLRLPGLQRVCKKLNIDCANAVIGFDFHQGACHPLMDGFVVCEEFAEIVTAAWHEDQENQDRKEQEKYEARVYGNWKKLIRGLLIRERLKKKYNF